MSTIWRHGETPPTTMLHTRRGFTLGAAAAIAALPLRRVFAAAAKNGVQFGYAAITWGEKGVKKAIAEIAEAGYPGIQLRSAILTEFANPEAVKADLAKVKLAFPCYSGGGPKLDGDRAQAIEKFMTGAKFAHAAGAQSIQVTTPGRPKDGNSDPAQMKKLAEILDELGKQVSALGVPLVLHPHMGQMIEKAEEMDAILAATNPKYVKLLLDVGHLAAAGGDPVAAVKRHAKRLAMLHIKDVAKKPDGDKKYKFVELGNGIVDFPGVFAALKSVGYKGWAVVELDSVPPERAPKDAAIANKAFLEKTLSVKV
jgi:inosose dehydratase